MASADIQKQLLEQIEFYFSDSNLPTDKHLNALSNGGKDWVNISELAAFNKIREITGDEDVIAEALRKSDGFLVVSEDGKQVKRAEPLPEDAQEQVNRRSLFVKGFPVDSTFEELKEFLSKHGKVLSLRLRRFKDRSFKGSLFVEFSTPEEADGFLAKQDSLTPQRARGYGLDQRGGDSQKKVGQKRKRVEEDDGDAAKTADAQEEGMDEKEAEPEFVAPENVEDQRLRIEAKTTYLQRKRAEAQEKRSSHKKHKGDEPEEEKTFTKNLLVRISGLGKGEKKEAAAAAAAAAAKDDAGAVDLEAPAPAEIDESAPSRESLRAFVEGAGCTVRFVDFERGLEVAVIRLADDSEVLADAVVEKLQGQKVNDIEPKLEALEGEDEKNYWTTVWEKLKAIQQQRGRGGHRGGRGGHRGRGRGRKQRR